MSIGFVENGNSSSSSGSTAYTFSTAAAVGDLLVAQIAWPQITTAKISPAISDSVNAGAWNIPSTLSYYGDAGDGYDVQLQLCWIRCDTAGTPVVTASSLGTQGTILEVAHYNGFTTGHPSLVTADYSVHSGDSTSPSATNITNSVANELSIVAATCPGGQNFNSVTGSFTGRAGFNGGAANIAFGDVVNATTGNTLSFGATIAKVNWAVIIGSWQDLPSAPPSSMFLTFP